MLPLQNGQLVTVTPTKSNVEHTTYAGHVDTRAAGYSITPCVRHPRVLKAAAEASGRRVLVPTDHVIAQKIEPGAATRVVESIPDGWLGVDIGPETAKAYAAEAAAANTVFWNGPMGIFEIDEFAEGTRVVAEAVAASDAATVVGGGDSLAAIQALGLGDRITPRELRLPDVGWFAGIVARYLPVWVLFSGMNIFSVRALGVTLDADLVITLIYATCVSWIAGFVIIGLPGGLGVREAVFISMMTAPLGAGLAVSVAVISRVVSVAVDLLGAAISIPVSRTAPPTAIEHGEAESPTSYAAR